MKVVITGGAGFIGSNLAEYLSGEGFEVHIIDNFRTGYKKNIENLSNVVLHEGSIEDYNLVKKVLDGTEYVFNLAALVSVPESIEKPEECISINVFGLLNLLKASVELGVKKIIHTSSAAVYGDDPELPKHINMKPAPKSPYGITKLDGEYYCNLYKEHFGLNTVSLRYFNVFGPKQDPKSQYAAAIPIFVEKALKNENITIFGDGNQTRDFVFVKDIVKANWKAATNEQAFGVFNVANGNAITINELAEKVIEFTNSKSKILYAEERPGDIKHSVADITETKEILGFAPSNNFDEELRITIDYFKKEKN